MHAKLFKKSWLCRTVLINLEVEGSFKDHYVKYNGKGIGNEKVYVDGTLACSAMSWLWFTPRFEFFINGHQALIEVRVSPWLTLQSLRLFVDGNLEYHEGEMPIRADGIYAVMSALAFWGILALLCLAIRIAVANAVLLLRLFG
jgi:hypothetical protein